MKLNTKLIAESLESDKFLTINIKEENVRIRVPFSVILKASGWPEYTLDGTVDYDKKTNQFQLEFSSVSRKKIEDIHKTWLGDKKYQEIINEIYDKIVEYVYSEFKDLQ